MVVGQLEEEGCMGADDSGELPTRSVMVELT
jgi:hypothetical protein